MKTVVTSIFPFPSIYWWANMLQFDLVVFEEHENFKKMAGLNRYCISGSNNAIQLNIPLQDGRNQKGVINTIKIFNEDKWQSRHWKTLVSVYKKTPFFEFYEPSLKKLFETDYIYLIEFNNATIKWAKQQIKITYHEAQTSEFIPLHDIQNTDFRNNFNKNRVGINPDFPKYFQVFEDRIGFISNLSILDLLFAEGPNSLAWLKENKEKILFIKN